MVNPSRVIIEGTLKSSFNFVLYIVNQYEEEHETIFKKNKKKFLKEIDLDIYSVKLVDDFPPTDMAFNVLYVKRSGKIVWMKVEEG